MTAVLLAAALAAAPPAANPVGHWEGTLDAPGMAVAFEVDIAKDAAGAFAGTITIPSQHLEALPLQRIDIDGDEVRFGARSDQLLTATFGDGGASMSGSFTVAATAVPFTLTRKGDAVLAPRPLSPNVGAALEGTWHGVLAGETAQLHLLLTVVRRPDGMALATVVNEDEGGLQLPVVITQSGSSVSIESRVVESAFAGQLTAAGDIVGTFHEGGGELPLTFRRNE